MASILDRMVDAELNETRFFYEFPTRCVLEAGSRIYVAETNSDAVRITIETPTGRLIDFIAPIRRPPSNATDNRE